MLEVELPPQPTITRQAEIPAESMQRCNFWPHKAAASARNDFIGRVFFRLILCNAAAASQSRRRSQAMSISLDAPRLLGITRTVRILRARASGPDFQAWANSPQQQGSDWSIRSTE